jgi:cation:H+ antiporter
VKRALLDTLTGHGPAIPLLAVAALGALIYMVASRLARHADIIAEETGLGGLWIGTVLLAGATSLPELLTDVTAALLDVPDIGVGDLFGSTMANMMILASLDVVFSRRRILHRVAEEHAVLGLLGILLTLMAGIAILTRGWGRLGHVGVETISIAVTYLGGMWLLFHARLRETRPPERSSAPAPARTGLGSAVPGFALGAIGLVVLAPLLVISAEAFSREAGVSASFVGTLLVGLTTSFPEMAATVSSIRLGALDLAVGNIFGSNAFNMVVLFVMDVVYLRGPLLAIVSRDHVLTVLLAVTCSALGIMAILSRAQRRPAPVLFESVLIALTYLLGALALYLVGRS